MIEAILLLDTKPRQMQTLQTETWHQPASNFSTWETEAEGLLGLSQLVLRIKTYLSQTNY